MKRNVSCAMLATLVIALTGPVLPAKAQECGTAPSEFRISAAQERTVTRLLNASQMRELNIIAGRLAEGQSYRQIEAQWKGLASQLRGSYTDVVALVQFALCEAYQGANAHLFYYAEKVKFFNELKKAIREEISRLRVFKSSLERGDRQVDFRPTMSVWQRLTSNYRPPAVIRATDPLDAILSKWEEELKKINDDAQLANVDMQNMLQKQQQTMQMMSNISKMLHDTAMAVIRKIGEDDQERVSR